MEVPICVPTSHPPVGDPQSLLNFWQCSFRCFQSPNTCLKMCIFPFIFTPPSFFLFFFFFFFVLPKQSCSGWQSHPLTGVQTVGELRPQYSPYLCWDSTQMELYLVTAPLHPVFPSLPSVCTPLSGDSVDAVVHRFSLLACGVKSSQNSREQQQAPLSLPLQRGQR